MKSSMKKFTLVFTMMTVVFAQNAPIDFEAGGFGANWTWTVFENNTNPAVEILANPDASAPNTSATAAKFTALVAGQPWAGCETLHGADIGTFNLNETNSTIKIMVYKPVISDVGIKLVKPDGWSLGEIKVANTVVNEWEELTFDFAAQVTDGYDQLVIFPDFDLAGRTQDNICYFDNITFHPHDGNNGETSPLVTFQVNMQYTDASQGVYLRGGNIGSDLPDTPSMGFQMSDDDGNLVYDVTLELDANMHYTYKFATGESWNWEGNWENVPGECGEGEYTDRFLDTGEEDMTLDPVCFGSCENCVDETINVTFNLDMSDVETSPDGAFLAGGGTFGVPGDNPMSDADGDDVWTITVTLPANLSTDYTFLNGNCGDWSCKENIAGQDCAVPPYSDRHIDLGTEDVTVNACFAVCGDGTCDELEPVITYDVTFQLTDSPCEGNPWVTGSMDGWSGWGAELTDDDGDGTFIGLFTGLTPGVWEYKYTCGGWDNGIEDVPDECAYNTEFHNRGFELIDSDLVLNPHPWSGCSDPDGDTGIVFSGAFGGTIVDGNTYTFPTGAESWAGFANEDTTLYPFSFPNGGEITFTGATAGTDVDVYFRFEYNPYPDVEPSYNTASVTVSGTAGASYSVDIPAQGENTFSSFLLYVTTPDAPVTLTNVTVISEDEPPAPVQVTFQVDMSHNPEILEGHTVVLQGEFAGWWPGIIMNDDDGDSIYTATVELAAGTYQYKFAGYEWSTTEFPDWSYTEDNAPSCLVLDNCTGENGECQFINRSVTVGASDATLSPVCWASCQTCGGGGSLVNGDFDGDDSVWTSWIVGESVEIDLSYTDDGPGGGSGEALRIVASGWGNGGVYQAVSLEENNVYELSGLFKGVGCDQNWLEISILDYEPEQGVDVGSADVIVKQHFWDCGATAPWDWDTDFANACGGNPSMIGAPPGVFQAPATGIYYLLIKTGAGVLSDVMFDNLSLGISDYVPTEGVSVTFNLDMSSVPTSEQGAYLAGGGTFGNPGDNPMSDEDGDDIWTITVQLDTMFATDYTFTNGICGDWGCKEDISGQDCAVPPYNDRHLETGLQSMIINACFAFCGDGFCSNVETDCSDGIDNDGDGYIDCDDSNCANDLACTDDFAGLINPSFEDSLDGWSVSNGGSSSPASIGSGDAHTGDQYLILNVGGSGWAVGYQENIPVNVGETWTFSSYIKDVTPGGAGGDFAALKLEFYDEFNASLIPGGVETIQQGVTDEWNLFSATYPLPENTVKMTVVLVATRWDGGGDANYGFDDAEFTCEGCETGSVTVNHNEGWNMIGLPLTVENSAYGYLFPTSVTGTLYGFSGMYTPASELTPGAGYWLVFSDDGSDVLSGESINSLTLELTQGWNMISGVTLPVEISAVDDPESIIVPGTLYGFSATYQNSSTLVPGQGYWINANADGDITISSGGAAKTRSAFTDRTVKANKLSFNGNDLYFGVSIPEEE
ncbi:MAG TPA: carbohydrate binding domain-containing protein, partial [Candidatus Marinimicrobia bacterium]|nr:carbohydrate binding domain-containing protein [Candidatus Neomarinimicrobiota bacterium]